MRNYSFLLLFFAFIVNSGLSQSVKINSGSVLEKKDLKDLDIGYRGYLAQTLSSQRAQSLNVFFDEAKATGYVGVAASNFKQYKLAQLNNYITLSGTKTLTAEVGGLTADGYGIRMVRVINNKRFIFYSAAYHKQKEVVFYVNELTDDLKILGSPIKLWSGDIGTSLIVLPSENNKAILLMTLTEGSKKEKPKLYSKVFDENFGTVWEAELDFKYADLRMKSVEIDDEGNLYLLAYHDNEKRQKASLYQYSRNNKSFTETSIGKPAGKTFGCVLKIIKGSLPVVAGLYAVDKEVGYFMTTLDSKTSLVSEIASSAFPADYVSIMKRGFYDPAYFSVSDLISTANSNYIMSVEGNLEMQKGSSSYYFSSPVFIKSVTSAGIPAWQRMVYKEQYVAAIRFLNGHVLIPKENDVLVVYNDHPSNAEVNVDEKDVRDFRGENVVVNVQRINDTGLAIKEKLPISNLKGFGFYPDYFIKIRENLYHTQFWDLNYRKLRFAYATMEVN